MQNMTEYDFSINLFSHNNNVYRVIVLFNYYLTMFVSIEHGLSRRAPAIIIGVGGVRRFPAVLSPGQTVGDATKRT